jgi:glycosyltransferase involved in cell wall biosynthesis
VPHTPTMSPSLRLCLVTRIPGVAGPANFQRRLASGLAARGVQVCYSLEERPYQAALVIGGTRDLAGLWRARRRGIPVFQRLDGMNWIHRQRRTGLRHWLRAEANNALLHLIRNRLADRVIYQSQFAREWWERVYGPAPTPASVVYNGVPLDLYQPRGPGQPPTDRTRLLVIEGNLAGGYEIGLEAAFGLARRLQERGAVEVAIAGRAPEALMRRWDAEAGVPVQWLGLVPTEQTPLLCRGAHFLYAADIHPACPNAVIEALACGLPVVSFDTGALPELVTGDAGRVAAYGGNPWRLDPPDIEGLAQASLEVLADQPRFRLGARARAEAGLGLDTMVDGYLQTLGWREAQP